MKEFDYAKTIGIKYPKFPTDFPELSKNKFIFQIEFTNF